MIDPLPVTADHLLAWLAYEASLAKPYRSARTIGTFRSAISTMHAESEWGSIPSPVLDPRITRFCKGVAVQKRQSDKARRSDRIETIDLTPDLILEMEAFAITDASPEETMCWSAACTGTFGLLRLNELLGAPMNRDRILKLDQITLYRAGAGKQQQGYPPAPNADGCHFAIILGPTKADQAGRNKPIVIAARPAVQALWRWLGVRHRLEVTRPELFCMPRSDPLTLTRLTEYLQDLLESMGRGRPHITGKAFRRGGASALHASGEASADAASLGHWKDGRMVELYANQQAKERRQLEMSRRMAN